MRDLHISEKEQKVASQRQQETSLQEKQQQESKVGLRLLQLGILVQGAWEEQREADSRDAAERARRADVMRKERNQEAQELIKQGSKDAKNVFRRNSSQVGFHSIGSTSRFHFPGSDVQCTFATNKRQL